MKVTIAIDSFKGSLSTFEAGDAIKEGVRRVYPDACVRICPLADGGEGTVDAIVAGAGGALRTVTVTGPLGKPVDARYGILPKSGTAVMEMSAAAGITLVSDKERNPLNTTTYGVGEMILDAIRQGCRKFIIGIGGSATNDGGIGMLAALGFEFLKADGTPVSLGGRGLGELARICIDKKEPLLDECEFCIACDVKNPLCGDNGCSAVYGPQKGATPEMVTTMNAWLASYAGLTKQVLPEADADIPGTGAAGGLGFAFLSYLGATLQSGVEIVMRETGLEDQVKDADVVVTGEGRLDGQSYMGKAPIGVASLAKKYGKPVLAFSGCVTPDAVLCNQHGIDAFFPILRTPCSLEDAMNCDNARRNLSDTAEQVFRTVKTFVK